MGQNDYHFTERGTLAPGLVNKRELEGVLKELGDVEHAEALQAALAEQIQTLKDKDLPMLKGTGFIVVDPANPRFSGEEIADFAGAEQAASSLSYTSTAGYAIIYAPIVTKRPLRPTVDSQPSELLKQIGVSPTTPAANRIADVAAPKKT